MSLLFKVSSSKSDYRVFLFNPADKMVSSSSNPRICIYDANLKNYVPKNDYEAFVEIQAAEDNKTLDRVGKIIFELKKMNVTKNDVIDVVGGGIIQDLCTLSASIYMRGIRWNYFPSTFLGMVDSCIGGKSSINHSGFKNLIGNFYPPNDVLIYPSFCHSLDQSRILEGLLEAIKICFVAGDIYTENIFFVIDKSENLSDLNFSEIIKISLQAKKEIIEEDEFDFGPRLLLNFGHTFGHALETATKFKIPHGIAVGVGMLLAFEFQKQLNFKTRYEEEKSEEFISRLLKLIKPWIKKNNALIWIDCDRAFECFKNDKKHSRDFYHLILPVNQGQLERVRIKKNRNNDLLLIDLFNNIGEII